MKINENEKCPVCQKNFDEIDDIVVCPKCGTPHHRYCYNSLGHCANFEKHNDDYSYEHIGNQEDNEKENKYNNDTDKCPVCSGEISNEDPFCKHCGARLEAADIAEIIPPLYESTGEKIEEQDVADVAAAVRTNTPRFIKKFKENKSISWNWCAAIFGPYYMLFRKMYKSGIITMILSFITSLVVQGVFVKQFEALTKLIQSNKQYYDVLASRSFNQDVLIQLSNEPAYKAIIPAVAIIFAVNVVIHLFCGLFADKLYRQKIIKVVADVNKKLEQGDSFAQSSFIVGNQSLSQKQMKALYLGRKGGTSIISPMIGYLALDIATTIISRL